MGCNLIKPFRIHWTREVPSEIVVDRIRVGTPLNLRRIRCGSLLCKYVMLMFYFVRDKWPNDPEEPDTLDGTHIRFGILVMHDDAHDAHCPDAEQ